MGPSNPWRMMSRQARLNQHSTEPMTRGSQELPRFTSRTKHHSLRLILQFYSSLLTMILSVPWDKFFYSRLSSEGCRFAGWLRIAFGAMFLFDRLILSYHLDLLLSPYHGLVPYWLSRETPDMIQPNMYSVFDFAPESAELLWVVHIVGILQGVLLMLGIAPRFQLLGIYLNIISFQHHNQVVWGDGEDMIVKAFCICFLMMPLHKTTVYDGFGFRKSKTTLDDTDSWPMWPIRLFQIQMMSIYIGASVCKFNGPAWWNGYAIHFITYSNDFYPGLWNPDFLFDRLAPLKLMAWGSLFVESICWNLIWVPALRIPILAAVIILHLGIEVTMNMHCFEWLAITGWMVFLLDPDRIFPAPPRTMKRLLVDATISLFVIWIFLYQMPSMEHMLPSSTGPLVQKVGQIQQATKDTLAPIVNPIGFYQYPFTMYDGKWGWQRREYRADMVLANETIIEWHSPDWSAMSYWERKRNVLLMSYYATLEQGHRHVRVQLLRTLADKLENDYDDGFSSITMYDIVELAPEPKQDISWFFDPVRSPMHRHEFPVMTLYPPPPCRDSSPECYSLRQYEWCNPRSASECPESCQLCKEGEFDDRDYGWTFHHPDQQYGGVEEDFDEQDEWEEEEGITENQEVEGINERQKFSEEVNDEL